tara:strand:- start:356 stop:1417 length:1062 start_codon:yes stop_codon:yes gene_type:complete
MAIFCLAKDLNDLTKRVGNIVVGYTKGRKPIKASQLKGHGPISVLLRDALMPNLVQTLENNPAFIHGGPFANIAHGCNSVVATKAALKLSDYVITEAGFGADLGAEKFLNIKCRKAGLTPSAIVLVATVRALKMHGGVSKQDLSKENVQAVKKGCENLGRHIKNLRLFGVPVVVAINQFVADTKKELKVVRDTAKVFGVEAIVASHWANGGKGTKDLAEQVVKLCEKKSNFKLLYADGISLFEKIETISKKLYGAKGVSANTKVKNQLREFEKSGYGKFPICMAKTQYSFSTNPDLKGAPSGHIVEIREVRLSAGAEFIVVITGEIMTMPGLPSVPAADAIYLNKAGEIEGLF